MSGCHLHFDMATLNTQDPVAGDDRAQSSLTMLMMQLEWLQASLAEKATLTWVCFTLPSTQSAPTLKALSIRLVS